MNNEQEYTVANATQMGKAQKRNFSKLPKVKYFRVQSRGAVGTLETMHERKIGGWAVLVALEGGNGLRLASDVLFEYGMKGKCEFSTKEDAFKAALTFKKEWGEAKTAKQKVSQKDEELKRKDEELKKKDEELAKMQAQMAQLTQMMKELMNK